MKASERRIEEKSIWNSQHSELDSGAFVRVSMTALIGPIIQSAEEDYCDWGCFSPTPTMRTAAG